MKRKQDDPQNAGDERATPQTSAESSEPSLKETSTGTAANAAADTGEPTDALHPEAESRPRSRLHVSAIIATLALLLALAAVLGVAWLAWQGRDTGSEQADTDATVASLADDLDDAVQSLGNLQEQVADLAESNTDTARDLAAAKEQIESLREDYESLPARVAGLETAMSSLQGISTGARENWWLAEAEYYMQIANAQLQLAGNPLLAREALRFADERVRQLGNPALTGVRRALSAELQALDAMESPDIEGITMRLASLADGVASLPIRESVAQTATDIPAVDPDAGPVARAWASLKSAFGDVVSVRRTDEAVQPLLSPDARYFLRANLALQMQTARLALLRGERSVFEQSLADAGDWLRKYYDQDSTAVRSALATLADIREQYTAVDLPDISESLRLLRQYRTLASAGQSVDTADDPADNAQ